MNIPHIPVVHNFELYLFKMGGPVVGNIYKNYFIGMSGFIAGGILILLLCAKLFLMYKESHDLIAEKFVKDITQGNHSKKVATKKPLDHYIPEGVTVLRWQAEGRRNPSYLLNPKTVPQVIDAGLAVIMLKIFPAECSYNNLLRVRLVFYAVIAIEIIAAIFGAGLSIHVMQPSEIPTSVLHHVYTK